MPTVLREVGRAERAGIVTTQKVGPTRLVSANVEHPLHVALSQLILTTYGPPAVVAAEFGRVEAALAVVLFGSWAARFGGEAGRAPNDVDVLVIGSPDRDAVDDAAERAERVIGLPVKATMRSRSQWLSAREAFADRSRLGRSSWCSSTTPTFSWPTGCATSPSAVRRHDVGARPGRCRTAARRRRAERVPPSQEVATHCSADATAHVALAARGCGRRSR